VISTTAFIEAAGVTASALGYDPIIVWVQHPIQDRTDQELRDLADKTLDEIMQKLTASP